MKAIIKNFLIAIILILIFYLLFQRIWVDWEKIKQYEFIFNYQNLLISYFIFFVSAIVFSQGWHYVLKCIEPSSQIKKYEAFKIITYSRLAKYIPGKIWGVAGRIYLGAHYNVSKRSLLIGSLLHAAISTISGITLGVFIISLVLNPAYNFFYLLVFPLIGLVILFNPKYFYQTLNFVIKKIGRKPITRYYHLNKQQLLFLYLQVLLVQILNGTAMFFMMRSFVEAPGNIWLGVVGITVFANVSGFLAVFSPGGIGVREGILTFLMKSYYSVGLAALISLLARFWLIIGEGGAAIAVFIFDKIIKQTKK